MVLGTKRRINFIYDSAYFQALTNISAYLENQGLEPNEDFTWRDNGHVLEIDQNVHFTIKECLDWQHLMDRYEQVGQLHFRS